MLCHLSFCSVGLPFPFKSGLSRYGNDDLLDFLRKVRPILAPSRDPQNSQWYTVSEAIFRVESMYPSEVLNVRKIPFSQQPSSLRTFDK